MIELGELCKELYRAFECNECQELKGKLFDTVINNDTERFTAFCDIVGDLTTGKLEIN